MKRLRAEQEKLDIEAQKLRTTIEGTLIEIEGLDSQLQLLRTQRDHLEKYGSLPVL